MTVEQLKKPIRYMAAITRSEAFREAEINPGASIGSSIALGAKALRSVSSEGDEWTKADQSAFTIISVLTDAVEAQQWLGEASERTEKDLSISTAEREKWIHQMIPFNHALRELFIASESTTIEDAVDLAEAVTRQTYLDPETAEQVIRFTHRRAIGMFHEAIAFKAKDRIEGYEELLPTTQDEELAGTDMRFAYAGRIVDIDIKSTEKSVKKARQHGYESGNVIPVYTGVVVSDTMSLSQVDDAMLDIVAGRLKAALESDERYPRKKR